jgi:hypothetical protein
MNGIFRDNLILLPIVKYSYELNKVSESNVFSSKTFFFSYSFIPLYTLYNTLD